MIINCLAPIDFEPEEAYSEEHDAYVIGDHLFEEIGWQTNDNEELEGIIDDIGMILYHGDWYDINPYLGEAPDDLDEMIQEVIENEFIWFQAVLK